MSDFFLPSDIGEIASRLGETASGFSGKTVLLSGGRGFLGRYFTEVFAHLNANILKEPVKLIVL
ncbi:MAG: nucleoside-diphosphate sugar epimerase, partial [Rhodospirillales bacterium]|nr:nucleoside-diphosphate sugar epimerase [Rhodospirillales bacterium]